MHDVFISYSRKDGDFVARVVGFFDEVGVTHWVDTADIEPAAVWREELQDAIIDADNVVFVISPHSLDSQECHRELRCATENHKRIVPAVYQPVRGDQPLPETLTRFQFLEVGTDDERAAFEKLALVIRDECGWRKTGTDLLRRAENWRREQGGLLPRVELEDARVWLEHGAGMRAVSTTLRQPSSAFTVATPRW